jgi:hypothetical protein
MYIVPFVSIAEKPYRRSFFAANLAMMGLVYLR